MNWLWMNVPLMAVFFAVWTGIPLWLTFRHPDTSPVALAVPTADEAAMVTPLLRTLELAIAS